MGSLITDEGRRRKKKRTAKKRITNSIRNKKIILSLFHLMGDLNVVAY